MDVEDATGAYRLQRAYADAILAGGGLPVPVPCSDPGSALEWLEACAALVITGGAFDIAPELYGDTRRPGCGPTKADRTAVEWALCEVAISRGVPFLGVCGGMQLMNVVRGGTLHQDLADDLGVRGHEAPPPNDLPCHRVELAAGSLLARLAGPEPLEVGSSHHQAVCKPGDGVSVCARAPDGVIEAIELGGHPFALGVQWHPERLFRRDPRQLAPWRGLVAAAEGLRGR